ncbi:MAG: hypothetical protein ACK56I_12045, partial [bacterium]
HQFMWANLRHSSNDAKMYSRIAKPPLCGSACRAAGCCLPELGSCAERSSRTPHICWYVYRSCAAHE